MSTRRKRESLEEIQKFVELFPKYSCTVIRTVEKRTCLLICRCETSKLPGQKYLEPYQ